MSSRSEAPPAPSTSEQRDWRRLGAARSLEEFSSAWLALAGAALGAERGVLVARRAGSERFAPLAFLPHGEPCGTFLADAAERALYEARPLALQDGARLGIAYPVRSGDAVAAIAAFEWPRAPQVPVETLMRRVQWGLGWVEARLAAPPTERAPAREERGAGALRRTLEAAGAEDAARAAATELAHDFGLDRAAAGFVADGKATLAALSHTAQFDPQLAMPRALATAIEEAARQGGEVVHAAEGRYALVLGTAGFCFERAAGFDDALRAELRTACTLLAPALALQHAAGMPLHRRAARSTAAGLQHWFGASAGRRRTIALLVLAAAASLFFIEAEFRVAGDATLEGAVRRVMSAPFDGYVLSSSARAGDVVRQGAPIAALDDRDLRLERVRSASQQTRGIL